MNAAFVGARNSSFVLLAVATLAIGPDVGVARITYGVALPALARDLQLSLTAAGLLGTLHLISYLLGTLASPSRYRQRERDGCGGGISLASSRSGSP